MNNEHQGAPLQPQLRFDLNCHSRQLAMITVHQVSAAAPMLNAAAPMLITAGRVQRHRPALLVGRGAIS
jgi:hypothetical protein